MSHTTHRRRVAITGIGVMSPLGTDPDTVWAAALAGARAVAATTYTNAASGRTLTVPTAPIPKEWYKPLDRQTQYMCDAFTKFALMACADAIADAGIDFTTLDRTRCGTSTGTCMSGITETEVGFNSIYVEKKAKVHPFTLLRTMSNAPAFFVSMAHGLQGPSLSTEATCSSSAVAIGEAARQIQHGYADVMVAGGTETLLNYPAINCWNAAQLLAPVADDPAQSCRPFDRTRNGTAVGEGAVYVVLEVLERARERGAHIYGEVAGYACTTDSAHPTQPSVEGQRLPMERALADAGLPPSAVQYVHAHGTGTKANDVTETQAMKAAFGDHARKLAISSSKGMTGHLIGAAGAFGVMLCAKALQEQAVPPTTNLLTPDPECDLDFIVGEGRLFPDLQVTMSNAFGFGGTAASLIVTAARD